MAIGINPRYGTRFDAHDLIDHIRRSGRTYIIQGQTACGFSVHPKPNSLDAWMRKHGADSRKNTKQADNDVITQLVETGLFREGKFKCPDSGMMCKGIVVVAQS